MHDIRYALRMLAKERGFTLVVILTLALGIGANTAIFSLTDQILLRLLPVKNPEELVILRMPGPKSGKIKVDTDNGAQAFSYPFYKELRDRNEVFSGLLARFSIPLSVAGQGQTERANGELVSGNYFEVLGVRQVDLGLQVDGLLAFSIDPTLNGYSPARSLALFDQLRKDLAALPGVTAASVARVPVLTDNDATSNVIIEGDTAADEEKIYVFRNWVGAGYFRTMGIPLLNGREFSESDTAASPKVAVINETMAQKYFANRNPVGMRFAWDSGPDAKPDTEIVGVVKNSKHSTVRREDQPFVYVSYAQEQDRVGQATFYLRSMLPPAALAAQIREVVSRRDQNLPVFGLKPMVRQVDESLTVERLMRALTLSFGLLAAVLASLGLYGVLAYTVARRTREIGIRMALGASLQNVRKLVLREAALLGVIGLAIGIPVAVASGRLAKTLLFQVKPGDPVLIGATCLLLAAVILLAAYIPARRAARVDPMEALRYE